MRATLTGPPSTTIDIFSNNYCAVISCPACSAAAPLICMMRGASSTSPASETRVFKCRECLQHTTIFIELRA